MSRTEEVSGNRRNSIKGVFAEVCFYPAKTGWGCIKQVQDCQRLQPTQLLLCYHIGMGDILKL